MWVSFYFDCATHGRLVEYLDSQNYPDRRWPAKIPCPKKECGLYVMRVPITDNFIQDSIGVSPADDKRLVQMDKLYNSKSYLKRDLKSHGMEALTIEEHKTRKFKSTEERHLEHFNRPDVARERHNKLSEAIDSLGVIDKLTEN